MSILRWVSMRIAGTAVPARWRSACERWLGLRWLWGSGGGGADQGNGRPVPHHGLVLGIIPVPDRDQVAVALDHHGLPPAALQDLSGQHDMTRGNVILGPR